MNNEIPQSTTPQQSETPTPTKRLHAMSCEYPEGCSCGASEHNALVAQLAAKKQELAEARAKADRYEVALHECHKATGDDAGDIGDFRALVERESVVVEEVKALRSLNDHLTAFQSQLTARDATIEGMRDCCKYRLAALESAFDFPAGESRLTQEEKDEIVSLRAALAQLPPLPSAVPVHPGYYWFTGTYLYRGEWSLVEVFRPMWRDPNRQDLRWRYLDGSGGDNAERDVATCAGEWSAQVLPPARQSTGEHQ